MSDTTVSVLKRLEQCHPKMIDLSLDRMAGLMEALGNPHRKLPPVVHIAGTNGKGSLIAYLTAMGKAAGLRVHRYISPHLVRFHERILLDHRAIDDATLLPLLLEVEQVAKAHRVTFFESTTAAAFLAFARVPADILLLEVGLGGRLDATNIIERPVLTAITPVSMDHMEYLGDTLEGIAAEKAGIIKPGIPCVIGPQEVEAQAVIDRIVAELKVPAMRYGHEWRMEPSRKGFRFFSARGKESFPLPNLEGQHQLANAATAIACAQQLAIPDKAIREGVVSAHWPGRLQRLTHGPLVKLLPKDASLWLDGGHNPAAGRVLADWLKIRKTVPVYMIVGMIKGKDSEGFLAPVAPHIKRLYTVPIEGEPLSQDSEKIKESASIVGMEAEACRSVEEAVRAINEAAVGPVLVIIAGSLYLAGQILQENY